MDNDYVWTSLFWVLFARKVSMKAQIIDARRFLTGNLIVEIN